MIADLKGIYETVEYRNNTYLKLYDNTDYEAYPLHWHTCLELIMPVKGDYRVTCEGRNAAFRENEILLICPGAVHSMEACEGMRYIFQADLSQVVRMRSMESFFHVLYPGLLITPEKTPEIYEQIRDIMLEIVKEYHGQSSMWEAVIYARLLEMMMLLRRAYESVSRQEGTDESKQKEYMEKFMDVCSYINEHCTEALTLDMAADRAGFSKYHFSRLFKQFSGVSYYRYLNKKRIEHAEQMLIDPNMSVTTVSLASGFPTLSSFIRMFKLLKGCTPSEYRNFYIR